LSLVASITSIRGSPRRLTASQCFGSGGFRQLADALEGHAEQIARFALGEPHCKQFLHRRAVFGSRIRLLASSLFAEDFGASL